MIERSSKHRMCEFCLEILHPEYINLILPRPWPYKGRVLLSNDEFIAVPGLGPQVFPYVLVISRRHFVSLTASSAAERAALFLILSQLLDIGLFPSRKLCLFEHGGCCSKAFSGCIDHFHLHVIDGKFDLSSPLCEDYETANVTVTPAGAFDPSSGRYLFTGFFCGGNVIKGWVAQPAEHESQYFRRRLADVLGDRWWNWRTGMNFHWMIRTMEVCRSTLKQRREVHGYGAAGGGFDCSQTPEPDVVGRSR